MSCSHDTAQRHYMIAFSSGIRPLHSIETAVLKSLSDILDELDFGDVGMLLLLDLSAVVDSVDHKVLLRRLEQTIDVSADDFS
jgi:hypothetical protein